MNPMPVYVVSVEGKPLHPTRRYGHVRWLLKHGKAKVVRSRPFQIQLLYKEVELYVTPEKKKNILGIDPGRITIGITVLNYDGEILYFFTRKNEKQRYC